MDNAFQRTILFQNTKCYILGFPEKWTFDTNSIIKINTIIAGYFPGLVDG